MDDDDDINSAASGSPPPSHNGRITVTLASAPPQQQPTSLAVTFPIQKANGGGREDCWSEGATGVLIEAWGERYLELSRGNLKQKHWKEVADIVSSREDYMKTPKTDIQCKNRIDTVKKKYKLEKAKIAAGGGPSKWPFFDRLDHLIGPTAKIPANSGKVPVGIPVGVRSSVQKRNLFAPVKLVSNSNSNSNNNKNPNLIKRRGNVETESESSSEMGAESDDSFPPEKRPRSVVQQSMNAKVGKERKGWGSSIRMLTQAILKFGEAYEQAESAKLQQVVEMEKARMKFAKELELQRMQFFMKTQMEISQLKRRGGDVSGGHQAGNNVNSNNNNISDSDS
ncbi:hypothetical protein K2173_009633 [Erythroxylum novogranatense]|uniref:Myb/SANT-like DNA-binding domain-containing protein n=1 Tax=Erythroxylum novogranatense TaxID=1862640 RepID=A0AAV8U4G0_9ROSI|nr:hypothetical protein K2173_009633 [Erythroxylum novogranatense]